MIGVIGSGPAGISAAIYIKRANIPVTIFTNHKSSLNKAKFIENYYGTGKIKGQDLYNKGIESAKELAIDIIEDTIVDIEYNHKFILNGLTNTYQCDTIILATGTSIKPLKIPGIKEFEGKGISYCTTCDGYFFRNKKIAIIGNGEYAIHEYEYLKNISPNILRFSNQDSDRKSDKHIINGKIKEISGNQKVEKIVLENNSEYLVDGIFIADNYADSSILAKKIGIITKDNYIVTDENMSTNIPGIYACGDNTKGMKQVTKAVYEGMQAGINAINYIKTLKQKH